MCTAHCSGRVNNKKETSDKTKQRKGDESDNESSEFKDRENVGEKAAGFVPEISSIKKESRDLCWKKNCYRETTNKQKSPLNSPTCEKTHSFERFESVVKMGFLLEKKQFD